MANKSEKFFWSFIAVVVAGFAYLTAFVLQAVDANKLAGTARWIAAVCTLIAWVIVFIFGWKSLPKNKWWFVTFYIVGMIMIIVFVFLPLIPGVIK